MTFFKTLCKNDYFFIIPSSVLLGLVIFPDEGQVFSQTPTQKKKNTSVIPSVRPSVRASIRPSIRASAPSDKLPNMVKMWEKSKNDDILSFDENTKITTFCQFFVHVNGVRNAEKKWKLETFYQSPSDEN